MENLHSSQFKNIESILQTKDVLSLLSHVVRECGVCVLDPEGIVISWSSGARRVHGYTAAEISGQHFSIFHAAETRIHAANHLEIARRQGRFEETGWRLRKDGSAFWAKIIIVPINDASENFVGFAKATCDISERKQAEISREKSSQMLAQINNELNRLAFVISHELQEPLATVMRYSNLLQVRYKDRMGPDADEFLQKIMKSSKVIARMVDDLWTYARITKPANFKQLNVNHILDEVLADLQDLIDESEAVITVTGQFPSIEGGREQLVYVFKELLTNAIKHHTNPGQPEVDVSALREREGWTFLFKDNGPGIDKFFSQEVFKIYHRLNARLDETGTGVGLNICKKIIEQQHQGHIGFQSIDGDGSTFFVWLPDVRRVPSRDG